MKPTTQLLTRRESLKQIGVSGMLGVAALTLPEIAFAHSATRFAPLPASDISGVYPFKIGNIEAYAISDGQLTLPASALLGPEASAADRNKVLTDNFLPTDNVYAGLNLLLLKIGSETILMDTGYGTLGGPTSGKAIARLTAAGFPPDKITALILSHIHPDHIGGLLGANGASPFTNAQYFVSKAEVDYWSGTPDLSKARVDASFKEVVAKLGKAGVEAIKGKMNLISPGDKIISGIEAVNASGHTPGHIALKITSGNEQLLTIGDAAHHHVLMFAHPEWTVAFDSDPAEAVKARRRLFTSAAADKTLVLGNHMPFPGLGHIRKKGSGYEWIQAPYREA